jgi:hypothetical protein
MHIAGTKVNLAAQTLRTDFMDAPVYYPSQECHRMHLLRSTLPICLQKTFEQFSYPVFCSCFDEKVTCSISFKGCQSQWRTV